MEARKTGPTGRREAAPAFDVLDLELPGDYSKWTDLWGSWPQREVFAHPAYCRLFSRPGDRVLCIAGSTENGGILFPLILRPLSGEPWAAAGETAHDVTTPYGYGGAFCWGDGCRWHRWFWEQYGAWARGRQVATSFARLSLFRDEVLPFDGNVRGAVPNVVRSLRMTEEELWYDYAHKVRKNVKRARAHKLSVEIDPAGKRLDDFLGLYEATMDRRSARSEYYFPRDFFAGLLEELPGQLVFFHALSGDTLVSTELVLVSARRVYSFLGGTLSQAFHLRPNDLLKHEIICWARDSGKEDYVLGGGYSGADGIFRYKLSFAPRGQTSFCVGEKVHDENLVRRLTAQRKDWERKHHGHEWMPCRDYFPAYRSDCQGA